MEFTHYTRSKAPRISLVANTQSDVDPDGVALQSGHSGPVRLSVTAAEKLESLPQELAAPPSAPVPGADGGVGSTSVLQTGASLSAPGGQTDPQRGQMRYPPISETTANQCETKYKLVLFDSGVPDGLPPDAAAVGEPSTLSAGRRPSTPRPRATSRDLTLELGSQGNRQRIPPFNLQNLLSGTLIAEEAAPSQRRQNLALGGCHDEVNSSDLTQVKSTNFYANLTPPKVSNLTLESVRVK